MSACLDGSHSINDTFGFSCDGAVDECYPVPAETQAQSLEPRIQALLQSMAQQALDRIRGRLPAGAAPEMLDAINRLSSAVLTGRMEAIGRILNHLSQLDACQNLPLDLINAQWANAGLDLCLSRIGNQIALTGRMDAGADGRLHRQDRVTCSDEGDGTSRPSCIPRGLEWIHRWASVFHPDRAGDGSLERQMMEQLLRKVRLNGADLRDVLSRLNEAGAGLSIEPTTPGEENPHGAVLVLMRRGMSEVRVPITH